jgi:RNA polymerase sigma-70 factor (ECF subfamily)
VVQETFLTLWNRAELFDPKVGSLAAWLHTIARNRTVDRLRAAGRRPNLIPLSSAAGEDEEVGAALDRLVGSGAVIGGAGVGLGPEGELATSELRQVIRDALADLPDAERTAIVLAYREELTQTEIAERLGWPLGTVKTRTRRALLRLRGALAEELEPGLAPTPIPIPIHERIER